MIPWSIWYYVCSLHRFLKSMLWFSFGTTLCPSFVVVYITLPGVKLLEIHCHAFLFTIIVNLTIAMRLGLFLLIFFLLFQEWGGFQNFLFLFFLGTEHTVWIISSAGVTLSLGKCSVTITICLVICVFT